MFKWSPCSKSIINIIDSEPINLKAVIQIRQSEREGGLFPKGHLSTICTFLIPVKSRGLFETLFFLPCVPESMPYGHKRFVVFS